MSERITRLLKILFHKSSLTDCSTKELQEVTDQYPSFHAGHLLLLKKMDAGTPEYTTQYNKAALYTYNPLQLDQWLADEETEKDFPAMAEKKTEIQEEEVAELPADEKLTEEVVTIEPPVAERSEEFSEAEMAAEDAATDGLPAEEELPLAPLKLTNPVDEAPMAITFEPYHTVDYFASQGIKLGKQEATNDQLGKQLKSFTEWLKTMKRVPASEMANSTEAVGERKVVNLAAHSLDKTDVVTESMAEVWLKQGNKEKAAEVYNKLSLLNPSKRAYFAAKLESLKKPN